MTPLTIVADDLTGAADTAVAFPGARVALGVPARWSPVVAVDLDSRAVPVAEAVARTHAAVSASGPDRRLYRKVDSTLRGHVAAEVAATAAALAGVGVPGAVAVVAPAFPATGRVVRDGVVWVDGRRGVDAVALLRSAGLAVRAADVASLARVAELACGVDAVVCDAVTSADLAVVAGALAVPGLFGVGSGGLARHLPATAAAPPVSPVVTGPVVTVVGSPAAAAQAAWLRDRVPTVVVAPCGPLPAGVVGADVLVMVDPDAPLAAGRGAEVADRLAAVACGCAGAGVVVATGGDVARAWLRRVGATELAVHREVAPGVVLSSTDVPGAPLLVSKAGGFGGHDVLADVLFQLTGRSM
ncbi:MAG TPA: four-carbon acid sugar kinase family protein [Pseudonocardiaceae bacterium]|nr:four-carbon acid sugar kinase family protein [Pseudonocardiaceae bacterium]